jgi:predicted nuclease of predicted toxin-antitoxin system
MDRVHAVNATDYFLYKVKRVAVLGSYLTEKKRINDIDIGVALAQDEEIFSIAENENRILVSSDTDFGTFLALWRKSKPSVILFRRRTDRRPGRQVALIVTNLPRIQDALDQGSVVAFEQTRLRIHTLPIHD